MSHIEISSNDLTLLSNDIDEINNKINNLKDSLNSKFDRVKDERIYENGFDSIVKYLDQELDTLFTVKNKIDKYQNEVDGIENAFGEKFNNIVVPNFIDNSSNLGDVRAASYNGAIASAGDIDGNEDSSEESSYRKSGSNNGSGPNTLGALSGLVGVLGASGLATSAYMGSKESEERKNDKPQEKTENKFIQTDLIPSSQRQIDELDRLFQSNHQDTPNQFDQLYQPDQQMQFNQVNQINQMNQMNQSAQLTQTNQFIQPTELNQTNQDNIKEILKEYY